MSKPTELNPTRRELWRTKLKTLGSSPRRGGNAGRAVLEELEGHRTPWRDRGGALSRRRSHVGRLWEKRAAGHGLEAAS